MYSPLDARLEEVYAGARKVRQVDYSAGGKLSSVLGVHPSNGMLDARLDVGYDHLGQVVRVESTDSSGRSVLELVRDLAGRVFREEYAGRSASASYDAAGQLVSLGRFRYHRVPRTGQVDVVERNVGTESSPVWVSAALLKYTSFGEPASLAHPAGYAQYRDYWPNGRLRTSGDESMSYDVDGNVAVVAGLGGAASRTYSYDAAGRLVSFDSAAGMVEYEYDGQGNMVGERLADGREITREYD